LFCLCLGNYSRREGARGSSWSAQNTPRGNYNESRGGQSNFNRGPLPPLRPLSSTGIHPFLLREGKWIPSFQFFECHILSFSARGVF
jgi:hypothetical protein